MGLHSKLLPVQYREYEYRRTIKNTTWLVESACTFFQPFWLHRMLILNFSTTLQKITVRPEKSDEFFYHRNKTIGSDVLNRKTFTARMTVAYCYLIILKSFNQFLA